VVYVGGGNNVLALKASTGALLWSYATGGHVNSSPAVANGVVYVGSADGRVYAFGLKKGRK
jgi:outer membrane protein assembly factor BamB